MRDSDDHLKRVRATLANALKQQRAGQLEDAERLYEQVLASRPDHFDALHMLGAIALQSGRPDRAVQLIRRALETNPTVAAAHANLALALVQLERFEEAVESYGRQIALRPDAVAAYVHLAAILGRLGRFSDALTICDSALMVHPNMAVAHVARAVALKDLQRLDAVLEACNRAIELQPDFAEAWDKRSAALRDLGRFDEAFDSIQKAISLKPDFALAHEHAGMMYLQAGDFERGWASYDWRTRPGGSTGARIWPQRRWTGAESVSGATVLLHSEQGLGDMIQFCRYATLVEARGAAVIVSVPTVLRRLMKSLSPSLQVIADTGPPPPAEWHCPVMSLPLAFATTLHTIPCAVPYLRAEPERVEHWRRVIGSGGFKVGICWQGRPAANDIGRSFPLSLFTPLSRIPGVRLISLQKGTGGEQLAAMPPGADVEDLGADFDNGADAFIDTAAAMESLDLIITPDTSIAHLAGALGRPTWVALKQVPDWRWLLGRDESPWYPTHRLFRQTHRGDWGSVFALMQASLTRLVASCAA